MDRKVAVGETVYVVENNRVVREASVLRCDGEFVLIRLKGMEARKSSQNSERVYTGNAWRNLWCNKRVSLYQCNGSEACG